MQAPAVQKPARHSSDVIQKVVGHDGLVRIGQAIVSTNNEDYKSAVMRQQATRRREREAIVLEARVSHIEATLEELKEMLRCALGQEKRS